jgi:hypothetical protein
LYVLDIDEDRWLADWKQIGVDTSAKAVNNPASVLMTDQRRETKQRAKASWVSRAMFFKNSQPISVGV